ncbi:MAG: pyroglutamyl-peptidase I [Rikenellaceae bacterium]|nr:pyroglutamyl-peptidase I [Rikenellaceae bacterium]
MTGFEPFGEYHENSSWEVARRVAICGVAGAEVVAEQLPVSFARVGKALRSAVELHSPDLLIMLGQSAVADRIKLERVALNMMDSAIGDNDGVKPDEESIDEYGAAALFTSLPIKQLRSAIEAKGINAKISNSAGLYVCNRTYYEALRMCREREGLQAIFVHLPLYEGQTSPKTDKKTMPLGDMCRAVQTIIEETHDQERKIQKTISANF